jgi:hypothetical protein
MKAGQDIMSDQPIQARLREGLRSIRDALGALHWPEDEGWAENELDGAADLLALAIEELDALLAVKRAAEVIMQLWREDPQATLLGIPALGEALAALQEHLKKTP